MNNSNYTIRLSAAITWLRFPLIFLIIMLHCYSVQRVEGANDLYFRILYPFSLWLGETGVPGFFFISGLLLFMSKKNYLQKLQTRTHTLLVPYLLWNFILVVIYITLFVVGYPQYINGRSMTEYGVIDYIRLFWDRGSFDDGNFVPILCPLWYIRNLIIMVIFSPLLYYVIKYTRELFLIIIAVCWMATNNNAFIPQTILFFSLGAYFPISGVNPLELFTKYKPFFLTTFSLFAIADIMSHVAMGTPWNLQIHRFALIFNIPVMFLLADWCTRHSYSSKSLPNAAFIVFCVHYPIVVILRKFCINQFSNASDITHILLYFACIITSTLFSYGVYLLLDKYLPSVKQILSGNR
jgi:peptidoglycan/LPS O-acetylase OafA/YrhL